MMNLILGFGSAVVVFGSLFAVYWLFIRPQTLEENAVAYMQRQAKGHDVIAEVEYADGQVVYRGADYDVEQGNIVLENGLPINVEGKGGEPLNLFGLKMVRVHAQVGSAFDTTTCVAMEHEEDGDYGRVDEHGNSVDSGVGTPEQPDQPDMPASTGDGPDPLQADGGTITANVNGHEVDVMPGSEVAQELSADHKYDLKPPEGTVGHTFSLYTAAQYLPHPITPQNLKDAEIRGKDSATDNFDAIKAVVAGAGLVMVLIGFLWLLGQIGGGSIL